MTAPAAAEAVTRLLYPRSIAVIGASDTPTKLSGRPIEYLARFGYAGRVLPINPRRDVVQGLPSYPDLEAVDGDIDLALIMVAADRTAGAVRACAKRGIPAAILGASGFAELGAEGAALQAELESVVAETGMAVLGPNCLGMVSVRDRAVPTFTSALDETIGLREGPVALVSQSGAFGFFMFGEAQRAGIGISHCLSTGNEVGLSVPELLSGLLETDEARVLLAYFEGVADGSRLVQAARRAHELDKPIVAVKVGRSASGARAAQSHTASLAGEDAVFDAIARRHGIVRVDGMDALLDAAQMFSTGRRARGRRLTALTVSGGAGVLMADSAAAHGLDTPLWDEQWQQRMAEVLPAYGSPRNPIDVTGSLISKPDLLRAALGVAIEHPDTDVITVLLGNADSCADPLIEALGAAHRSTDRPMAVVWTGGSGRPHQRLRDLGIPCYSDPGRAAAALGALADYSLRAPLPAPIRPAGTDPETARALLRAGEPLDEHASTRIIAAYGIPCSASAAAATADEAAAAADGFDGPVAVKLLSPHVAHKSDLGGVRLGLSGAAEVRDAANELLDMAARNEVGDARILVQRMAEGDVELIAGVKRDAVFGPVVVVGFGGILVEVLGDTQAAIAPVDRGTARSMLTSLRGSRLFGELRGRPALDVEAAAEVVERLSWLAADLSDELEELDVNPLLLGSDGAIAVDCLAVPARG